MLGLNVREDNVGRDEWWRYCSVRSLGEGSSPRAITYPGSIFPRAITSPSRSPLPTDSLPQPLPPPRHTRPSPAGHRRVHVIVHGVRVLLADGVRPGQRGAGGRARGSRSHAQDKTQDTTPGLQPAGTSSQVPSHVTGWPYATQVTRHLVIGTMPQVTRHLVAGTMPLVTSHSVLCMVLRVTSD